MFAHAFDLVVAETERRHPKSVPQAYADIGACLGDFGFNHVQGSLDVTGSEDLANLFDMANLFAAITALKALPWRPPSVRDIRAFRVEQWSDFTDLVKS